MKILIVGATGNVGRQVIAQLPATGAQVRALVRNPQTAALPSHVEIVRGDLTVPETFDAALEGIDTVFLVWFAPPATVAAVMQRIVAQARRIVFLSSPYKTQHPLLQAGQPNILSLMHQEIERHIETSGRQWTFLRPGMLSANARVWWSSQIRAGDPVRWPYLDVPTTPVDERDLAAIAVRALCEEGHHGAEYLLTGPEALTQREQIATLGEVLGRPLQIEELSPDAARQELSGILPGFAMTMLLKAWSAAAGHPAFMTSTIQEITGTPARTFRDWAVRHAAEFRPAR